MPSSDVDYYKVLGVGRHATDDEIKKSFRKLARELHPDKNPNDPNAKENFQQLQQAYDTLRDALERSKYDALNSYHGRDASYTPHRASTSTAPPRSSTASRYTSTPKASTGSTWTHGAWADTGYTYTSARTRAKAPTARTFAEDYGGTSSSRKTRNGYDYSTSGTYRAPMNDDEFDDPYSGTSGSYGYDPYASPRKSAYAETRAKSTSYDSRSKSTTGTPNKNTGSGSAPQNDIASYIRQKQAQEAAQKRREEEEQRRKEEEARAMREVREAEERMREQKRREEQRKREAEEAERRRQEEEKEAIRRREEREREEAYRREQGSRSGYGETGYSYNTYSYGGSSGARSQEDEANRMAEEKLRERKVKTPSYKKPSKTRPRSDTSDKYRSNTYDTTPGVDADVDDDTSDGNEYFRGSRRNDAPYFNFGRPTEQQRAQKAAADTTEPEYSFKPKPKDSPRRRSTKTEDKPQDKPAVNPFKFQEADTPNFEFNFGGDKTAFSGAFTARNSPEPKEADTNHLDVNGQPVRPKSQPSTLFPNTPYVPSASVPPTSTNRPNLTELYQDLLKTAEPFMFTRSTTSQSATSSIPKKKTFPLRTKPKPASNSSKSSTESQRAASNPVHPTLQPQDVGLEPMDLAPDTGIPTATSFTVPSFPAFPPPSFSRTPSFDFASLSASLPPNLYPTLPPTAVITTSSPPPTPPKLPKIPEEVSLNAYNRLLPHVQEYISKWIEYEKEIARRREMLRKDTEGILEDAANPTRFMERLESYVREQRERVMGLERVYERARERHLRAVTSWVELRRKVVEMGRKKKGSLQVAGAPAEDAASPGVQHAEMQGVEEKAQESADEMEKEPERPDAEEEEQEEEVEEAGKKLEEMKVKVEEVAA